MARFNYKIKNDKGVTAKGIVEAVSLNQAVVLLHERGFTIITLKEVVERVIRLPVTIGGGFSFTDLVHITRQLATMITAGLTLVESLSLLRQQIRKPSVVKLITDIENEVKVEGKSLAYVLEKYPKNFPPIYRALVRAGEASGKLDLILTRLADNLEKSRDFRNKIKGAMIYPAIVMIGMVVVSVIVMTVVVPRMTSLYQEFGAELPLPTKILIVMSNIAVNYWLVVTVFVILSIVLYLKVKNTYLFRHITADVSLRLPVIGTLLKQSTLVEITRTLALLLDGGVPILTSLEIAQNATGNILFQEIFQDAAKKVEKGLPLSEPLGASSLFPPILPQMVMVGEQTGKLGDSLLKLSHYFETEAEEAVRALTTIIEPLIMVVLGVGVAFLVMAILLPIYSLTSKF